MMADRRNGAVLREVRSLFGQGTVAGMDEGRLLERFVARADESAFEALVARFGPMVLGICRRLLDNPHDVDDAFQASFLILVKKAGTIRDGDLLGNWLYGVAFRVATRARLNARRRHGREVAWAEEAAVAPSELCEGEWRELRAVLDEEVSRLPEKYRAPLCLCYLQDQSYEEAARRLKWPIGTVRSRLAKARELMRTRLVRRGIALPAAALATALGPKMSQAALPPALLEMTTAVAMRVVGGRTLSAGAVSAGVAALTQEVMTTMFLVKLKWVVGLVLILSLAGSGAVSLARRDGEARARQAAKATVDERKPPLPSKPLEPPVAPPANRSSQGSGLPAPVTTGPGGSDAARRLVERLKQLAVKPSKAAERIGLYLIDVNQGGATLIVDEPEPGRTHCGSACWSSDGTRILFDSTPGGKWNLTHVKLIDAIEGRLAMSDLGPGNCPSFSPDGKRVAFIMNSGALPDAEPGVWVMNADGSERRRVGGYGRAKWSPDGRQILLINFSTPPAPTKLALMDVETGAERPIPIAGQQVFSVPSWAGEGTIVAAVGSYNFAESIALIDVAGPKQASVKKVLWKQKHDLDLDPGYPLYSVRDHRCTFVGRTSKGQALYSLQEDQPGPPRRLEPEVYDKTISDLSSSPDGRYVIFCSDRPTRRQR